MSETLKHTQTILVDTEHS